MTAQRLCKTRQTHLSGANGPTLAQEAACERCGRKYAKTRAWQKYCSERCRKLAFMRKAAKADVLDDHEARLRAIEKHLGIGG